MPKLTLDEQGTHSVVKIYSDDEVMQRRLERIGAKLTEVAPDGIGRHYTLLSNQLSLRKPTIKRLLTAEQRAAQVLRGQKLAQARRIRLAMGAKA